MNNELYIGLASIRLYIKKENVRTFFQLTHGAVYRCDEREDLLIVLKFRIHFFFFRKSAICNQQFNFEAILHRYYSNTHFHICRIRLTCHAVTNFSAGVSTTLYQNRIRAGPIVPYARVRAKNACTRKNVRCNNVQRGS